MLADRVMRDTCGLEVSHFHGSRHLLRQHSDEGRAGVPCALGEAAEGGPPLDLAWAGHLRQAPNGCDPSPKLRGKQRSATVCARWTVPIGNVRRRDGKHCDRCPGKPVREGGRVLAALI